MHSRGCPQLSITSNMDAMAVCGKGPDDDAATSEGKSKGSSWWVCMRCGCRAPHPQLCEHTPRLRM
jgi:hypothetical protein